MNSEIKIVDNFLNEEEHKIFGQNAPKCLWKLQKSLAGNKDTSDMSKELPFLYSVLTNNDFFNSYLFDKVVEQLDGDNYTLERVYLNGQWNGREGNLHKDGCDFTALIYMTCGYEYGWGGFTEIMTEPEPTLIHPIPNRLVIFPGNISHKAYSFAYQDCPLRVTLAFKINVDHNEGWI